MTKKGMKMRTKKKVLLGKQHDVSNWVSTGASRYSTHGILIDANKKIVVACDGMSIIVVPIETKKKVEDFPHIEGVQPLHKPIIVDSKTLSKVIKSAPMKTIFDVLRNSVLVGMRKQGAKDECVSMTIHDGDTSQETTSKPIYKKFAPYEEHIPNTKPDVKVPLSCSLLRRLCDYGTMHGTDIVELSIYIDKSMNREDHINVSGPLRFDIKTSDDKEDAYGVIMPIIYKDELLKRDNT